MTDTVDTIDEHCETANRGDSLFLDDDDMPDGEQSEAANHVAQEKTEEERKRRGTISPIEPQIGIRIEPEEPPKRRTKLEDKPTQQEGPRINVKPRTQRQAPGHEPTAVRCTSAVAAAVYLVAPGLCPPLDSIQGGLFKDPSLLEDNSYTV